MSGAISYYDGTTIRVNTPGTSGQVLVSQGTGAPIFQTSGFQPFAISTLVGATPYTAAAGTDYFIPVDTTTLAITVQLPDAPTAGQVFIVKDAAGNALVNNITVTTVSGTDMIDGGTSFSIATNWRAVQFIFNGTQYYSF
jgi:hypothetical protein